MAWKKLENTAVFIIVVLAFLLTNKGVWLCLSDINNPLSFCSYGNAGSEIPLLFFASCLSLGLLWRRKILGNLIYQMWRCQRALVFFIVLSLLSIFWTVLLIGTIFHLLILVFSTVLAIFLGVYFSSKQWNNLLLWFCVTIVISSITLLIFFPNAAIMAEPHLGSWRGVFWHKNFTGSFMALANTLFLNLLISSTRGQRSRIIAGSCLYILSLILTIYSLSAAGLVTLVTLNGVEIVLFLWSKVKDRLTQRHYYVFATISVAFILLIIVNKNFFFNLIDRSPNLTGRIPLWQYLIESTVLKHPMVGHGFGAIWLIEEFRKTVTLSQGWGFQIMNGHSGFMDTLLNLGFIGLLLIIFVFISAFYKTANFYYKDERPVNMVPLLVVLYVLIANFSISFIQEIESFHWMILVSAMFLTSQVENEVQRSA